MALLANIYRSSRKEEMYLYVAKAELLTRVPEALLQIFGTPVLVTTMLLKVEKKLARADVAEVIRNIETKGFYLQMPPALDNEMRELAIRNNKLSAS
jgi:uncharacterized protein YcgL (UPF0745 family)